MCQRCLYRAGKAVLLAKEDSLRIFFDQPLEHLEVSAVGGNGLLDEYAFVGCERGLHRPRMLVVRSRHNDKLYFRIREQF